MGKKYSEKEVAQIIAKSMWKSVKKAMVKNPVQDVLDADFRSEAKPDSVPVPKAGVMYKSKSEKLKGFLNKRKDKLKNNGKL